MLGDSEPGAGEQRIAIAKYLDIEALRLDNRLRVDWNVGKFRAGVMRTGPAAVAENAINMASSRSRRRRDQQYGCGKKTTLFIFWSRTAAACG